MPVASHSARIRLVVSGRSSCGTLGLGFGLGLGLAARVRARVRVGVGVGFRVRVRNARSSYGTCPAEISSKRVACDKC